MCACANKGEKLMIEQKLVVHRALRVHTCGESCTGKGEMHGASALFSSWFSFRFWHDCVEPVTNMAPFMPFRVILEIE